MMGCWCEVKDLDGVVKGVENVINAADGALIH